MTGLSLSRQARTRAEDHGEAHHGGVHAEADLSLTTSATIAMGRVTGQLIVGKTLCQKVEKYVRDAASTAVRKVTSEPTVRTIRVGQAVDVVLTREPDHPPAAVQGPVHRGGITGATAPAPTNASPATVTSGIQPLRRQAVAVATA